MIIKSFEINKIELDKHKFILLYGKNDGLKAEITNVLLKDKINIKKYEEKDILDNSDIFIENIISNSLFENEKIIIIKRVTDKLIKIVDEILTKNIEDVRIIFNAGILEKKSKIRALFEKNKYFACVPFYPDTDQTLFKLCNEFLKKKEISISPSNINLIVNKCNGDRKKLSNELQKIEYFCKNGKKLQQKVY